jgi:hypothetical protein
MVGMWLPSPQAKAPPEKDLHDRCSPPQIQATLVPTNVKADSIRTLPENAPKDPPKINVFLWPLTLKLR